MNEKTTGDWTDLAKLWQADAAGVSVDEIDEHLRRHRRQMRVMTLVELAGAGLGVAAGLWLAFELNYRWLGLIVGVFALATALAMVRLRRELPPSGSVDVLQSLKDSMAREDWIVEQLGFGRALSFVALFAIIMAMASQLRQVGPTSTLALMAGGVAAACVTAALVWNLLLVRRSRIRKTRLAYLIDRLKS